MSGTQPGPVTAYLAEVRHRNEAITAKVAGRGWSSEDDAWDQLGPMGVTEWSFGQQAQEALRLLAALEAALRHHQPGKVPWCEACGPLHQPCQEVTDIRRALLGEGK